MDMARSWTTDLRRPPTKPRRRFRARWNHANCCCSGLGSARLSRVGFGVSPKQSLQKKPAMTRRYRQHARGVRYPEQRRATTSHSPQQTV